MIEYQEDPSVRRQSMFLVRNFYVHYYFSTVASIAWNLDVAKHAIKDTFPDKAQQALEKVIDLSFGEIQKVSPNLQMLIDDPIGAFEYAQERGKADERIPQEEIEHHMGPLRDILEPAIAPFQQDGRDALRALRIIEGILSQRGDITTDLFLEELLRAKTAVKKLAKSMDINKKIFYPAMVQAENVTKDADSFRTKYAELINKPRE